MQMFRVRPGLVEWDAYDDIQELRDQKGEDRLLQLNG